MNITLAGSVREILLDQVAKGAASLEAEIVNGIESGEPTSMTGNDWSKLRGRVRQLSRPS